MIAGDDFIGFFLFFFFVEKQRSLETMSNDSTIRDQRGREFVTLMEFIARLSFEEHV